MFLALSKPKLTIRSKMTWNKNHDVRQKKARNLPVSSTLRVPTNGYGCMSNPPKPVDKPSSSVHIIMKRKKNLLRPLSLGYNLFRI